MFWRGACLLRGVSSLPAIKRKLRVNPPSLPRLITIYPHPDLKVKSQKKVRLKIIVIFQSHFNFNFDPPPSSLSPANCCLCWLKDQQDFNYIFETLISALVAVLLVFLICVYTRTAARGDEETVRKTKKIVK